jgi:hypothetical protein
MKGAVSVNVLAVIERLVFVGIQNGLAVIQRLVFVGIQNGLAVIQRLVFVGIQNVLSLIERLVFFGIKSVLAVMERLVFVCIQNVLAVTECLVFVGIQKTDARLQTQRNCILWTVSGLCFVSQDENCLKFVTLTVAQLAGRWSGQCWEMHRTENYR